MIEQVDNLYYFRELAYLYLKDEEYDDLAYVLDKMIKLPNYQSDERDYYKLLIIYSKQKNIAEIKLLVKQMLKELSGHISVPIVQSIAHVLLREGEKDFFLSVMGPYVKETNDPDLAILIAELAKKEASVQVANDILVPFAEANAESGVRPRNKLSERLKIQISLGKEGEVLSYMKLLLHDKALPEEMHDKFIELMIKHKKFDMLLEVIGDLDLSLLSQSAILYFLEVGMGTENSDEFVTKLWSKVSEDTEENSVVLFSILKILNAKEAYDPEKGLEEFEYKLPLKSKPSLARIYLKARLLGRAMQMMAEFPMRRKIEELGYYEITLFYSKEELREQAISHMESVVMQEDRENYSIFYHSYVLLMIADEGGSKRVQAMIKQSKGTENYLADYYFWSYKFHHKHLKMMIAQQLYNLEETPLHHEYLLESYLENKRYKEIFVLLQKTSDFSQNMVDRLFFVLNEIKKTSEEDFKQVQSLGFVQKIYPTLRDKEWFTVKKEREFAYGLLNLGMPDMGEQILFELSKHQKADYEDVYELVHIWDEYGLSLERKKWLIERLRASENEEFARWGEYLVTLGESQEVLLALDGKDILSNKAITDVYIAAMMDTGRVGELTNIIQVQIDDEKDPTRLRRLAVLAFDIGIAKKGDTIKTMRLIYEESEGKNTEIAKDFAIMLYYDEAYDEAYEIFTVYFAKQKGDFYLNNIYAELLEKQGEEERAMKHYDIAYTLLQNEKVKSVEHSLLEARLLLRKKEIKQAVGVYEQLMDKHPLNKEIRLQYGRVLMDMGEFEKADKVLSVQ